MGDVVKVAITLALGFGRLGHIAYLTMGFHIGSRCAARRDWGWATTWAGYFAPSCRRGNR